MAPPSAEEGVHALACAVGRIDPDGPWVGFAPTLDDTYALVVGLPSGSRRADADADLLITLAIAYFEDALAEPPEDLAATHGDIAALVRHVAAAAVAGDAQRLRRLNEAVDAIDDGLAADVVIARLSAVIGAEPGRDPVADMVERCRAIAEGS